MTAKEWIASQIRDEEEAEEYELIPVMACEEPPGCSPQELLEAYRLSTRKG